MRQQTINYCYIGSHLFNYLISFIFPRSKYAEIVPAFVYENVQQTT